MKVYLKKTRSKVDAVADYDVETKECIVLKGSIVSENIANSAKFRGATSIKKVREQVVKDHKVVENVKFKSASTAANFVTGASTNGLIAWKDKDGRNIKEILEEGEND